MKKKIYLFPILLFFAIFLVSAPSPDWTVQGDSVYVDDENVYINVTPHTSNQPVIEFRSKNFVGDIDVVVGFDNQRVIPVKAEFNPQMINVTKSYTCDGFFNYTLSPKHFWCYTNVTTYDNQTNETLGNYLQLVFEHDFDFGNIGEKTASWDIEKVVWNDVSGAFSSVDKNFMGFHKWYYVSGYSVVPNQTYNLRLTLQSKSLNDPSYKYFFGIKPSSESFQEAIAKGHFYYIDPWTDDLSTGLVVYYKLDEGASGSGDIIDSVGYKNGTNVNADNTSGLLYSAYNFTPLDRITIEDDPKLESVDAISVQAWVYPIGIGAINAVLVDKGDCATAFNLQISANIRFCIDNTQASTTQISNDNWHHVVGTFDKVTVRLYVNGDNVANTSRGTSMTQNVNSVAIGSIYSGGSNNWKGKIDEVGIWNVTLNLSQVRSLYNSGSGLEYDPNSDSTSPKLTINNPPDIDDNFVSSYNVTFNFTFSDDVVLDTCKFNVTQTNGTSIVADTTLSCSNDTAIVNYQNASFFTNNTLTIFANDSSGNENITIRQFNVSIGGSQPGGGPGESTSGLGGSGSFIPARDVLKSERPFFEWNPDYYKLIGEKIRELFSSGNLKGLFVNTKDLILYFGSYIFRQPATLGGVI